jgi:hypothetical protein
MRWTTLFVALMAVGCAGGGSALPPTEETTGVTSESLPTFCAATLSAPEVIDVRLGANDVRGIDCIPPAGGQVFSLGFAHAGWWMQLDIARPSLVVGEAHAFDGQAALLAVDCWEWDGGVTVDEDDGVGWALRVDAHCRGDASLAVVGRFGGER